MIQAAGALTAPALFKSATGVFVLRPE